MGHLAPFYCNAISALLTGGMTAERDLNLLMFGEIRVVVTQYCQHFGTREFCRDIATFGKADQAITVEFPVLIPGTGLSPASELVFFLNGGIFDIDFSIELKVRLLYPVYYHLCYTISVHHSLNICTGPQDQ